MNWDERLGDQVKKGWENYKKKRLDLSAAQELLRLDLAGEFLYVEAVSSASAIATVRLNRNSNDEITLSHQTKIRTIFTTLFITHTAQAGEWIDLIIGINFEYFKPDNIRDEVQQVLNLTHANPDTNVAGAANICNTALIKADVLNTDIAWIDFGVAAVQDSCMPLDPGEWIRVSISNTDQINANFEVGGEIVYICYEV